jgi:RNA polymerase sigma-70 factor (ECF subfamily)
VETSPNDFDLVARLNAGDPVALETVLAAYWSSLVLYAARLLQDDMDGARDVAQETFVRLWKNRTELKHGSMKSYLFHVARNLILDEVRKREVRQRWRSVVAGQEHEGPPTPSEVLESRELEWAVAKAINDLPLRRREVFTLAYLHRLPYRRIAELMGTSPATVKNQMSAALADLRDSLRPHGSALESSR